ncbi:MAG: hypothetical protein GY847_29460 [Proteobacteria bacterium]|nr:hypothetical protein [Pseudomonadota bacterium]
MSDKLKAEELINLMKRVFSPTERDKRLVVILDLPDEVVTDTPDWRARREMASEWVSLLAPKASQLGLDDVRLFLYQNPHANNANLPAAGCFFDPISNVIPAMADELMGTAVPFNEIFESFQLIVAPTQFSATAPLKMAAKEFKFRAATMPGFNEVMIPALRLDYGVIGRRVDKLAKILDDSTRCDIVFDAMGTKHELVLDLRHRNGTASGGVFPIPGTAGNVPSGESYIVPYEGEINGDPTMSSGEMPVQLGEDIVVYRVENNVAAEVISQNNASRTESEKLAAEPAYGNIAELGLGVLGDFGLAPTGELLLDEKLGLHIAFGRSEHFGGQVGPSNFSSPDKVVHIDRVYTPEIQPNVKIKRAVLTMEDGREITLMENGKYVINMD